MDKNIMNDASVFQLPMTVPANYTEIVISWTNADKTTGSGNLMTPVTISSLDQAISEVATAAAPAIGNIPWVYIAAGILGGFILGHFLLK
jgi:hypothetical protein